MRTSVIDSATMLQGIGTWHLRITTSKTTGLPNQAEYTGEKLFVLLVIMSVILSTVGSSAGIDPMQVRAFCSADETENLFNSENPA
jgi:hypothetical protein